MNILTLDLGSTTGYAMNEGPHFLMGSHTWATDTELRAGRAIRLDRRKDIRVVRFYQWARNVIAANAIQAIVFEDVQFHKSLAQTQLWSSFRTAVWLAAEGVNVECLAVGTLKKFATGSGAADKTAMRAHLVRRHPELFTLAKVDDNAIDAAWLWVWSIENLAKGKT